MTWPAPNTSAGFHDELKELWEAEPMDGLVLLAGEGKETGLHFKKHYPKGDFVTVNMDPSLEPDIVADMCKSGWIPEKAFNVIINQANLEHVYDPFGMVSELSKGLVVGGIHMLHTHTRQAEYHAYPRDYFRFMDDWFEDLPKVVSTPIERVYGSWKANDHIFAAYRRIG